MKKFKKIATAAFMLFALFFVSITKTDAAPTYMGTATLTPGGCCDFLLTCPGGGLCFTGYPLSGQTINIYGYGAYDVCSVVTADDEGTDNINEVELVVVPAE